MANGQGLFFLVAQGWFRTHGARKYMLPATVGSLCMVVGFGLRCYWKYEPDSKGIYAAQNLFLLLTPCAYLAQSYILLPRLAFHLDAHNLLFLPAAKIGKIFIWTDVATFFLQASGGGLSVAGDDKANIGKWITIIGLALQCISFGFFSLLLLVFIYRVYRTEPSHFAENHQQGATRRCEAARFSTSWRTLIAALIANCVAIICRSVFRLAEYVDGYESYLATHEGYFYLLDALPLLLGIALFALVWPPSVFRAIDDTYPTYPSGSPGTSAYPLNYQRNFPNAVVPVGEQLK